MVEHPQEVKAELAEFLNNAAGAHAMSLAGIRLAQEQTLTHLTEAIDADQHVVLGIATTKNAGRCARFADTVVGDEAATDRAASDPSTASDKTTIAGQKAGTMKATSPAGTPATPPSFTGP